jgi:hypothetical protein
MRLLVEATVVGIALVIFGNIVGFVVGKLFSTDLPPLCKDWNKNYAMEISLFLSGALLHLFFELTGVNRWYCKKGNACRKR